jgi:hypothetical protein
MQRKQDDEAPAPWTDKDADAVENDIEVAQALNDDPSRDLPFTMNSQGRPVPQPRSISGGHMQELQLPPGGVNSRGFVPPGTQLPIPPPGQC